MGDEIRRRHFEAEDFSLFRSRLDEETQHLASLFETEQFSTRGDIVGFELEACIVDRDGHPAGINAELLRRLKNPLVVPELAEFNVELNGSPVSLRGSVFDRLHDELSSTWEDCCQAAEKLGSRLVITGILPTIHPELLNSNHMSAMVRYQALNDRIMGLRDGAPLDIEIAGTDTLSIKHEDVMLEAATTSFQIHLQCKPEFAARDFNASLVASAPLVALAANSPFLFGKSLWAETRIPLFEQSIDLGPLYKDKGRVYFGTRYADQSMLELFIENQQRHVLLLPYVQSEPMMKFAHLRFQNGTIWRWVRPLIGFDYDGTPHVRIEQRTVPAGPTTLDSVANCAAYIGFVRALVDADYPIEKAIDFETTRSNFYEAAQHGLEADIVWRDNTRLNVGTLILDELLPMARKSLVRHGVTPADTDRFLDIVEQRVETRQTGTAWQRKWVAENGPDFAALTREYADRQDSNEPVHTW